MTSNSSLHCQIVFSIIVSIVCSQRAIGAGIDVDSILAEAHRMDSVKVAPLVNNHLFVRRVTLDLLGRIPTIEELEAFDSDPNYASWVNHCLSSDEFPSYWSEIWTSILIGRNPSGRVDRQALQSWLAGKFRQNESLDQIAFDLIAARGVTALDGPVNFLVGNQEDPVTAVSRAFLGVQLDCARCHDHPYDRWTQQDYTDMKRFFSPMRVREVSGGFEVLDLGTHSSDPGFVPRFLTNARPKTLAWRSELALMVVRSKPFARAMGNRIWQLLFGQGIVDPVDGLSQSAKASVPELHDALGEQLRSSGFDLRETICTICLSKAYRRSSSDISSDSKFTNQQRSLFAFRMPRPLTPEQLARSYAVVANRQMPSPDELNQSSIAFLGRSAVTAGVTDPIEFTRTSQGILRELAVNLAANHQNVESLFLSVLSRLPDEWEKNRFSSVQHDDALFALLHCNEFILCD